MASTFEEIAKLLPQEQAEQFLILVAQFQTVPDDDEYLQILEAIGLMTLLWKQVPDEVRSVLEGANPVTETCHSVAKQVREAVIESIPSYEDLQLISKRLSEHEVALKRTLAANPKPISESTQTTLIVVSTIIGSILGFLVHPYLVPHLP